MHPRQTPQSNAPHPASTENAGPRPIRLDRRQFHQFSSLTLAQLAVAGVGASTLKAQEESPSAAGVDSAVISKLPHRYHGWPTVARAPDGELFAVCSGGRESHVCPFGRVELMRSKDEGKTWSWPQAIIDGPIDDRDAGVLITSKGTILVSTFTSLAYEGPLRGVLAGDDAEKRARWLAAHERISAAERKSAVGVWMTRSDDHGLSFSQPYRCLVNSPHGPIEVEDGRLLYAGKELWSEPSRIGVCESLDDGKSWQWLAAIPTRKGDDVANYHELHAVEAADGTLIAQIRNHNPTNARETLQSHSTDGGKTWSVPRSIGVWGLPSHLLRLGDGRLLMSYGHRRPPFGNQARLSDDNGKTWGEPMIISGDGAGGDLGYPSTVELNNRDLLTVWYEKLKGSSHAVLRQRRWSLS